MDPRVVLEIARVSKEERWPYPRIFAALREAGVARYTVRVHTRQTVYEGRGGTAVHEPVPADWSRPAVAEAFDGAALRRALRHHAAEHTPYEAFLADAAAAGVRDYAVDMASATVTYTGSRPGETHVEHIR